MQALFAALMICGTFVIKAEGAPAKGRAAVTAAEVNGTFVHSFGRKFGGLSNTIEIHALGHNKLNVSFDLYYPHLDDKGQVSPNLGSTEGEAVITRDTAVFKDAENGSCKITIKFTRPGQIVVNQSEDSDCGFGHNVTATGTYQKLAVVRNVVRKKRKTR